MNPSDIQRFPAPKPPADVSLFDELSRSVERDYVSKGKIIKMHNKLTGDVELESLTPAGSKSVIDEIDTALAEHYGFTAEELDFIINYDIKYRLGQNSGEEEDE